MGGGGGGPGGGKEPRGRRERTPDAYLARGSLVKLPSRHEFAPSAPSAGRAVRSIRFNALAPPTPGSLAFWDLIVFPGLNRAWGGGVLVIPDVAASRSELPILDLSKWVDP